MQVMAKCSSDDERLGVFASEVTLKAELSYDQIFGSAVSL